MPTSPTVETNPKYLTAARGNFYANVTSVREDGKRFGTQVARQRKTLNEACRAVDETGLRGYVQRWNEHLSRREVVAERDEAGNWWTFDHFTGTLYPYDPAGVKA